MRRLRYGVQHGVRDVIALELAHRVGPAVQGLARAGVRLFWRVPDSAPQPLPRRARLRPLEAAATILLLACVLAMTAAAGPLMRQADAIARQLRQPGDYVEALQGATPVMRQP